MPIGKKQARTATFALALAAAVLAAACGGGGGGGGTAGSDMGSMRFALTDAPACGYDHVWVTIEKISINASATAGDGDGGWIDMAISPAKRVDLLSLTNGVLEELGTMPLAAGHYSQLRLQLASNTGSVVTSGIPNAVQPTGGTETALSTPSAQQSGLKLKGNFDVAAGQMADVVLDFDACKSVVRAGNSGQYILKPVVSVVPRAATVIQGYVATTLSLGSTTVSVQQNGSVVRSTAPDSTGKFVIPYLPDGTYTLVVSSEGHATAVMTGVPASATATTVNGTATAIAPPTSAMADVTGTVVSTSVSGSTTVSTVITDANMIATQALTDGPTIVLGAQPVDATLGSYRFHLPVAAPVKSAYSATSTPTFTADTAVAGKYTITAQSPGRTDLTKPADVSSGSAATVNFSWGP